MQVDSIGRRAFIACLSGAVPYYLLKDLPVVSAFEIDDSNSNVIPPDVTLSGNTIIPYVGNTELLLKQNTSTNQTYYYRNYCYVPLEMQLVFKDDNLELKLNESFGIRDGKIVTLLLPPRKPSEDASEIKAFTIEGDYVCKEAKYKIGSRNSRHDDKTTYTIPFPKGVHWRVIQGNESGRTHVGDARYCFDLVRTAGDEMSCMRAGVVYLIKEDLNEAGFSDYYKNKGNKIEVIHGDGSIAVYGHLEKDSVTRAGIKLGDEVKEGRILGRYGMTGYTSCPHLEVYVGLYKGFSGGFTPVSIKDKFKGRDENLLPPLEEGHGGN